jgi:hypothetical protein
MSGQRTILGRRRPRSDDETEGLPALPDPLGLAAGTVLGWVRLEGRVIAVKHNTKTAMWCEETEGRQAVGLVVWGDNLTPHLKVSPAERTVQAELFGVEAETIVRGAMALWRTVFKNRRLDQSLPVSLNRTFAHRGTGQ